MSNRIQAAIEGVRPKVAGLPEDKRQSLDEGMALTFSEHFQFQQKQAEAHASGLLSPDEALVIYSALGESMSEANGGWQEHADTATKVIVTKVIGELVGVRA